MRTLIHGATCVLPDEIVTTNVLIEDGRIVDLDPAKTLKVDETIDARGLHLLPGVIDDQVHFREPGLEHKEDLASGSRACAKGGITTFFEMPNTSPTTTDAARLEWKLARAAETSLVNFAFFLGATADNLEFLKTETRTPGIKIFIGSSTGDLLVDAQEALERIFAETTLPITAHCEDEATVRANRAALGERLTLADHSRIRDHAAAKISAARAFDLALRHHHQFHLLHVSTADEVELLRAIKSGPGRDLISAEACPHHLFFNLDDYARLGSRVQMNPSIKTAADNQALWQALLDGTIDLIATDHAPHTLEEKALPYPKSPSGLPAVENSLALMLDQVNSGRCTLAQVVRWMCSEPARTWHLPHKGRIEVGNDADLVLVDLNKRATIRDEEQVTKCRWSPWHGTTLQGWPTRTIVAGKTVFCDGRFDESVRGRAATFRNEDRTDLDELWGSWSSKEADAFDLALAEGRRIDPKLWR